MAMPSLNHLGQSLSRWCSPLLKAIWCVASWTIVETVPGALGLARNSLIWEMPTARPGWATATPARSYMIIRLLIMS